MQVGLIGQAIKRVYVRHFYPVNLVIETTNGECFLVAPPSQTNFGLSIKNCDKDLERDEDITKTAIKQTFDFTDKAIESLGATIEFTSKSVYYKRSFNIRIAFDNKEVLFIPWWFECGWSFDFAITSLQNFSYENINKLLGEF